MSVEDGGLQSLIPSPPARPFVGLSQEVGRPGRRLNDLLGVINRFRLISMDG